MSGGGREGYSDQEGDLDDLKADLVSEAESAHTSPVSRSSSTFSSPSLEQTRDSVRALAGLFGSAAMAPSTQSSSEFEDSLKKLKQSRGGYKGRITRVLKSLREEKAAGTLDESLLQRHENTINQYISKIEGIEDQMSQAYDDHGVAEDDSDRENEVDEDCKYLSDIQSQLAAFERDLKKLKPVVNKDDLALAITEAPPSRNFVKCPQFSGNSADRLTFKFWLSQFETMLAAGREMSGRYKLSSLRNHLVTSSLAFRLIADIEITDDNYETALDALKAEFLDLPLNRDLLFEQLLNKSPTYQYDPGYENLRMYIAEVKSILNDLKKSYAADLFVAGGYLLARKIVFDKIPPAIQKALMETCDTNYPTLDQIFDNIRQVIATVGVINRKYDLRSNNNKYEFKNPQGNSGSISGGHNRSSHSKGTLENFQTNIGAGNKAKKPHCRFCENEDHATHACIKYKTLEERKTRCTELNLCFRCASNKHMSTECQGKRDNLHLACYCCKSQGHISALCPKDTKLVKSGISHVNINCHHIYNPCYTTGVEEFKYLLPIINLKLRGHHGKSCNFNFLFDTASQRSYMSKSALDSLDCDPKLINNVEYEVKTMVGSCKKELQEVNVDVFTSFSKHFPKLLLVDEQLDINFRITGFSQALENFKSKGYRLAGTHEASDTITVQGLMGVDLIQYLPEISKINCMKGSAWSTSLGIIPFGDINSFLSSEQSAKLESSFSLNYNTLLARNKCPSTLVNFVLEPHQSYDDPFESFFDQSLMERRMDKFLGCDALADAVPDQLNDYDALKIKQFKDGIELIDGKYHVDLVWHESIKNVQNNFGVAINVLDRVHKKLSADGRWDEYVGGFEDLEKEGVIERLGRVQDLKNLKECVLLPHRPVFKETEQSTTKMRPVFNASLKTKKGAPSLNEASYCGINLMRDMTQLLMLFRSNKYIYVGDIRKAFLMIHLKRIYDRNKFCFLLKIGNEVICFRFTTIIFGFNASPFILNYVLQHHINSFPQDDCTEMMRSGFFVDNLIKTLNDEDALIKLYSESVARLAMGNFQLRSCNTNSDKLKAKMQADNKFVEHGCDAEKVLGYNYYPSSDVMKLAKVNFKENPVSVSKRFVVSQTSKVFDPLNLSAPVAVRSKTLISKIWKEMQSKVDHWDETISEESCNTWNTLKKDLEGLSDMAFPRYSLSEDLPADLYLFSDASKEAYGYVAYAVQEGQSGFLMAKTKVAPLQGKTLPTLELMGAHLAYKGVIEILNTFKKVKINNVYVAVDAQIVISWILSQNMKTKNIYARNRVLDIRVLQEELAKKFNINVKLKYVATELNPADLLTRGLSLDAFKKNLTFWLKGPTFIQSCNVQWPTHELGCLTDLSKSLIMCTQNTPVVEVQPLVPFEEHSKLNTLLSTTAKAIEIIEISKNSSKNDIERNWGSSDFLHCSKLHLIKVMQSQTYSKELEYLKNPKDKAPILVINLNLFIDKIGILRAGGRIGKHANIKFDLAYPIMLAKEHPLTKLIIEDCHERCLHLGVGATLSKVRLEGFWIPRARQVIRKVLTPCFTCKRFNGLPFKYPKVTNLPKHRVNLVQPFKQVGIDFTGEIILTDENNCDKKHYLLVFTCLTIRAIYIEVLPDRETKSVVLAFIRFTNLHGIPSHLYSDNEKSFIAGGDVIKHVFKESLFVDKFSKYNIKHITIPCYSAWVGSTWERLIRVIKSCLYKTIGNSKVNYFQMTTVVSDIVNAVNARPLTYRCAGDHGLEIISPNCFVKPYVHDSLMFCYDEDDLLEKAPPSRKVVVKALKNRDQIISEFKKLWHEEYLLSLREQCKDLHEIDFENKIRVNDVVLVKGPPMVKRPFWKLGRVVELFPGDDGKIRSVKVKRSDGEIALHSLCHLYPMELSLTHAYNGSKVASEPDQLSNVEDNILDESEVRSDGMEWGTPHESSEEIANSSDRVTPVDNLDVIISPDSLDLGLEEVGEDFIPEVLNSNENSVDFIENEDLVERYFREDPEEEQQYFPSGRPMRNRASRGRPLDGEYIYY